MIVYHAHSLLIIVYLSDSFLTRLTNVTNYFFDKFFQTYTTRKMNIHFSSVLLNVMYLYFRWVDNLSNFTSIVIYKVFKGKYLVKFEFNIQKGLFNKLLITAYLLKTRIKGFSWKLFRLRFNCKHHWIYGGGENVVLTRLNTLHHFQVIWISIIEMVGSNKKILRLTT